MRNLYIACGLVLSLCAACPLFAQSKVMRFDTRADHRGLLSGHIAMGTSAAPDGTVLGLTDRYLLRNGKPWYAMMGEMHFTRVPRDKWEESVLKMKSNGIDIIATYVFWNHHEEAEGQFDWAGIRDLKAFIAVCAKHHMYVWLRIGPWCHGEVRNGGLPDWLLRKTKIRGNYPVFLQHVDTLYNEIVYLAFRIVQIYLIESCKFG